MSPLKTVGAGLLVFLLTAIGAATDASAKPARCSTTDDGDYTCNFVLTDRNGSFKIAARGKPTFTLEIIEPGVALGYGNFGSRNVALPGRFRRSSEDQACWVNDATEARLCVK